MWLLFICRRYFYSNLKGFCPFHWYQLLDDSKNKFIWSIMVKVFWGDNQTIKFAHFLFNLILVKWLISNNKHKQKLSFRTLELAWCNDPHWFSSLSFHDQISILLTYTCYLLQYAHSITITFIHLVGQYVDIISQ